jgi:GT2 family glycosyltransferase
MEVNNISALTVTYFSDITVLSQLIESLRSAASILNEQKGYVINYFIVDNSVDKNYFSKIKLLTDQQKVTDFFMIALIDSGKNLGYGKGNNLILDDLVSRYHLVVNPDVYVATDSLLLAVEYMESHEDTALISPKVRSDAKVLHVIKNYPDCLTLALRFMDKPALNAIFSQRLASYQREDLDNQFSDDVLLSGGCFMFFRSSVFKALGGFDQRYFMYFEDYDLSLRLKKLEGGRSVYCPEVEVFHMGGYVRRKSFRHYLYFVTLAFKFFNRHGWRLW